MDKFMMESLKGSLPVVPGINGKEEYINYAVLALLKLVNDEYHFVFEKRSANIRQPGEICFPGGKFDPKIDVSLQETAIRETSEELGVTSEKIKVIGNLDTVISPWGATVDAFLGIIDIVSLDELQLSTGEVDKVFTVPVSYFVNTEPETYKATYIAHPSITNQAGVKVTAKELDLPERYWGPWGKGKYNIFIYRVAGETIWGMTAKIIINFVAKLKSLKDSMGFWQGCV